MEINVWRCDLDFDECLAITRFISIVNKVCAFLLVTGKCFCS